MDGLLSGALLVWSRLISQSRIGAHRERAKAAAHFAVQRWLLGLDEALLTCALVEWRNAGIAEARSRKAARAHATVELAIDKWALGRHAGVLHRVVARWRQLRVAAAQEPCGGAQTRARFRLHICVALSLSGCLEYHQRCSRQQTSYMRLIARRCCEILGVSPAG